MFSRALQWKQNFSAKNLSDKSVGYHHQIKNLTVKCKHEIAKYKFGCPVYCFFEEKGNNRELPIADKTKQIAESPDENNKFPDCAGNVSQVL